MEEEYYFESGEETGSEEESAEASEGADGVYEGVLQAHFYPGRDEVLHVDVDLNGIAAPVVDTDVFQPGLVVSNQLHCLRRGILDRSRRYFISGETALRRTLQIALT